MTSFYIFVEIIYKVTLALYCRLVSMNMGVFNFFIYLPFSISLNEHVFYQMHRWCNESVTRVLL